MNTKFLGTHSLLFEHDHHKILIDPYFSRPSGVLGPRALFRKFSPNEDRINQRFIEQDLIDTQAIIVTHSHIDHVLDVPFIAKKCKSKIYGSSSTANVALGSSVPDEQIVIVDEAVNYHESPFTFSFHKSKHLETHPTLSKINTQSIDTILKTPAKVMDFKAGEVYVLKIEAGGESAIIFGSAGPLPETLVNTQCDTVFAGIGGLQYKPDAKIRAYIDNSIQVFTPKKVYITHWDLFTRPISPKPKAFPGTDRVIARFREKSLEFGFGVEVMGIV